MSDHATAALALALIACVAAVFGGFAALDRAERGSGRIAGAALVVAGTLGALAALVAAI